MPFTPFHFGPGAAVQAIAPKQVSFIAFCAANVLIDFEPLYYMVTDQYPLHRFFHTYIGATIIVFVTLLLFTAALKISSKIPLPNLFGWKRLNVRMVLVGAAIGSYSHIVFDSIMHSDIRPFNPFSESNPILHIVPLGTMHWAMVASGMLGLIILGIRKLVGGKK